MWPNQWSRTNIFPPFRLYHSQCPPTQGPVPLQNIVLSCYKEPYHKLWGLHTVEGVSSSDNKVGEKPVALSFSLGIGTVSTACIYRKSLRLFCGEAGGEIKDIQEFCASITGKKDRYFWSNMNTHILVTIIFEVRYFFLTRHLHCVTPFLWPWSQNVTEMQTSNVYQIDAWTHFNQHAPNVTVITALRWTEELNYDKIKKTTSC